MLKKGILLLLTLLHGFCLWSQNTLRGTVTGSDGAPLVGATVLVKNTNIGAVADNAGVFTLKLPAGDQMLIVSYTGYGSREVAVGAGMRDVEITLEEGVTLRETVVTALGITRSEKSLGYAVAQVVGSAVS